MNSNDIAGHWRGSGEQHRSLSCPLAVACTLALSGCLAGSNFTRPSPPAADRYSAAASLPESVAPGEKRQHLSCVCAFEGNWWDLFRSPSIDGIVKQAIEHNSSLAASAAALAQARELAAAQNGTRYPQISLTGGIGRQKYGDEFLGGLAHIPPFTYFAIGATVSYALDYTGGIARGVERQKALAELALYRHDAAYLSTTGRAVMQVLAISSARAQIATVETLLGQDRDNLQLVETAFKYGSVAREDVVSAQSQIASDLTLLPPLHQELAQARHALSVILGRVPAAQLPPDIDMEQITVPLEIPVSLPSELAHRRPDILAAEAQLHADTIAVGIADSNLYPRIQLSASVGPQSLTPGALFDATSTAWSLISGITAPIFNGGTLRAERRAAVDALQASAANYQQTVLEAFAQVADTLDALKHDDEQLSAQAQAKDATQSSLDLARASYQEGEGGILRVLDAERSYQRARLGYVRAVSQQHMDTVQLLLALGGTSPT